MTRPRRCCSGWPEAPGYLRPLLCLTRADTEAVCRACGERWVTDETNDADDYARNRLRHGALPALCGVNSAAEHNLARFCEKAAKADEYFARQADALLASARATDAKSLPGGAQVCQYPRPSAQYDGPHCSGYADFQ